MDASLGVACGGPAATADDLISRSDTAMYASKLGEADFSRIANEKPLPVLP